MAQTAAHLVDHVIPSVPVRQWVLSLPIRLRLLLAAQPKLVTPVLQVVHRVITRHLLGQADLKADEADSGAVTLIQRFGSAANLNIHLHCLVLDGVYRRNADGAPVFMEVPAPTDEVVQTVLHKIITRLMKLLTRTGMLVKEQGQTCMADDQNDSDEARSLRPLQAAACTYRIAFGSVCTPPCALVRTVYDGERAEHASEFLIDICERQGVAQDQLTVHSDNGSPMKGQRWRTNSDRPGCPSSESRARASACPSRLKQKQALLSTSMVLRCASNCGDDKTAFTELFGDQAGGGLIGRIQQTADQSSVRGQQPQPSLSVRCTTQWRSR